MNAKFFEKHVSVPIERRLKDRIVEFSDRNGLINYHVFTEIFQEFLDTHQTNQEFLAFWTRRQEKKAILLEESQKKEEDHGN